MDLSALLIFAGALLVAASSPGPSVAALAARHRARLARRRAVRRRDVAGRSAVADARGLRPRKPGPDTRWGMSCSAMRCSPPPRATSHLPNSTLW